MTAPIFRGRIHAIVVPDGGDAAAAGEALRRAVVPNADVVDVSVLPDDGGIDALNTAALVQNIDYFAIVRAGVALPDGWLADCVDLMRSDLSTGLVGWSPSGLERGELELFVCRDAFVVRHSAFHFVSGLDPELGPEVFDIDLGWRLWLAGYRVRSVGQLPAGLSAEPADPDVLADAFPRLLARYLDGTSLGDVWRSPEGKRAQREAAGRRYQIQSSRARGDGEVLPLAHASVRRWAEASPGAAALVPLLERWGAPERAGARRRIAVVTADTLAKRMAGPGIRATEIAKRLATEHDVVLATTGICELVVPGLEVRQVGELGLRELEDWCDVFVFQGWVIHNRPHLLHSHKVLVVDIYDPMHLEQLEQGHDAPGERGRYEQVLNTARVLDEQLERGDFFLCASAKQRDLWIGHLAGLGRVNPVTYDGDESLHDLLAIAPFGIGEERPVQTRSGIRGAIDGIGPDDKVILWGGGVYNWFDPITLVHAVHRLSQRMPEVRLLFLGMKHPNPGVPQMRAAYETEELAGRLGIEGSIVFFNRDWVEYDERHNFLLDADVGVSTHLDHIETEFSFRTRILDYLWASLPIVATDGDSFATIIRDEGIGEVVAPGDVEGLEQALERILSDPEVARQHRENIERMAPSYRWSVCLEPLAEFCRAPRRAHDVACPDLQKGAALSRLATGRRRDVQIALSYLRAGAVGPVVRRVRHRLRLARS
jgi:glycosyltransferase involved in cell wall biosynthesis